MILLISSFITGKRGINRYVRFDIFKYMISSYSDIQFSEIYIFVLLDSEFINRIEELEDHIFKCFSRLPRDKIHIVRNRYVNQCQWIPVITEIKHKHGGNELVWFSQNDDHVFIDFNMDILNDGLKLLKDEPNPRKTLYLSHWPEIIKRSGKYETPTRIGNYVKFNMSLLDSIQIFSMDYLYYIFVEHIWKTSHIRIDSVLNELVSRPTEEDTLNQIIYVPLRELVRHFDGYDHVRMDSTSCPLLVLPKNVFTYSNEKLINKITARHTGGVWIQNNNFIIPQEWIDINISLHSGILSHSLPK